MTEEQGEPKSVIDSKRRRLKCLRPAVSRVRRKEGQPTEPQRRDDGSREGRGARFASEGAVCVDAGFGVSSTSSGFNR